MITENDFPYFRLSSDELGKFLAVGSGEEQQTTAPANGGQESRVGGLTVEHLKKKGKK